MESIPNRASNAGPDVADRPNDWRDEIDCAIEQAHDASRYCTQYLAYEYQFRRLMLLDAIEHLQEAIKLLPNGSVRE